MKKGYRISVFLMIGLGCAHAQDSIKAYNGHINKAELAIVDNNFKSAFQFYETAFQYKEQPFAIDLYNATICAIKTTKTKDAFLLCNRLADKGVGAAFFEKKSIFDPLKQETLSWQGLIAHAKLADKDFRTKNKPILDIIDTLYEKDQEMHRKWANSDFNNKLEREMKQLDSTRSAELLNAFRKYGYLSEDILGATVSADTVLELEPKFGIIMLHNYQGRIKSDTLFTHVLRAMLSQGRIKPEYFADIQDRGSNFGDREYYGNNSLFTPYKCSLYQFKVDKEVLEQLDKKRESIALYSLADFRKKFIFNLSHPYTEFLIGARSLLVHSFADKESEAFFKQIHELIIKDIPGCIERPPTCIAQ